jgi:hypothetical protein
MLFDIVGNISRIELIATGKSIRILSLLEERYGQGNWRKLKGIAGWR